KAVDLCDARLVSVSGPAIDELLANNPYFVATRIPGGLYSGNSQDVPTFGVTATLVSSTEVPADTVYKVMAAVFDHLDELRRMHPAFAGLQGPAMARDGLTAPAHDGALNYFVETGLR
ncbi:MAG: C4-dicarboxylate ABC transporter substrate-binding protein, partial [Gammaproteobacteria bacterium]